MNKTKYFFFFLGIFMSINSMAQKPYWCKDDGNIKSASGDYIYYIGFGEGNSFTDAKVQAFTDVKQQITQSKDVTIYDTTFIDIKNKTKNQKETFEMDFIVKSKITGKPVTVYCLKKVAEYPRDKARYKGEYYAVYRLPKSYTKKLCEKDTYKKYGIAPIWRSALIPGWGQYYKKEKKKGRLFLGVTIITLTGATAGQIMYSDIHDKAYKTYNSFEREDLLTQKDRWGYVRTGCLIGAGIAYAVSIYDAVVAKGQPQFAFKIPVKIQIQPDLFTHSMKFGIIKSF